MSLCVKIFAFSRRNFQHVFNKVFVYFGVLFNYFYWEIFGESFRFKERHKKFETGVLWFETEILRWRSSTSISEVFHLLFVLFEFLIQHTSNDVDCF